MCMHRTIKHCIYPYQSVTVLLRLCTEDTAKLYCPVHFDYVCSNVSTNILHRYLLFSGLSVARNSFYKVCRTSFLLFGRHLEVNQLRTTSLFESAPTVKRAIIRVVLMLSVPFEHLRARACASRLYKLPTHGGPKRFECGIYEGTAFVNHYKYSQSSGC